MTKKISKSKKNIILIVGMPASTVLFNLLKFKKEQSALGKQWRLFLMHNQNKIKSAHKKALKAFDKVLKVNFNSPKKIIEALLPYQNELVAATCRFERKIPEFAKVVPHIPYLKVPTSESLIWSTEKILMRRRFRAYDKKITPKFSVLYDDSDESIKKLEQTVGFPLIIKPSGLAQSLLVTIAYHHEELKKSLKKIFRKIRSIYKEVEGRGEPRVLVEQFLEGDMYSIDAYVDWQGRIYFCPMVFVKTGKAVGFDDFFGYLQMTPTRLSKESIKNAEEIAAKAIYALGLKNSTAHIELMKTEKGWKIIELGPRVGGFRQDLYQLAYGFNHTANDIFIRIPRKPIIYKRPRGHAAAMKFFAKKEGILKKIKGIRKIKKLESFHSISLNKHPGNRVKFAKNGGSSIFNVILFNPSRSRLLADIRRLETTVDFEVEK